MRRHASIFSKEPNHPQNTPSYSGEAPAKTGRAKKASRKVTEARATAQRTKPDRQGEERKQAAQESATCKKRGAKKGQQRLDSRRANATIARAIDDYLLDHIGGNHSDKTLEWHRTALRLMQVFLEEECKITLVEEIDATDINAWFAHMRKTPGSRGKPRAQRTIQTYPPSARPFFPSLLPLPLFHSL